jgi:hydroxymethylpyrimidine pyrophosphatase-like HAD family hydrolase
MKNLVVAFDLDGTLIDSTHRQRVKEDGSFDIEYWLRNIKYSKISEDSLLPLYDLYLELKKTNHTIIAVTARKISLHDMTFFKDNGIYFDKILHRGDSKELDEVLKDQQLQKYFEENGLIPFIAFDDKQENLDVFDKYGFRTFHATYMNDKLLEKKYNPKIKPENYKN